MSKIVKTKNIRSSFYVMNASPLFDVSTSLFSQLGLNLEIEEKSEAKY